MSDNKDMCPVCTGDGRTDCICKGTNSVYHAYENLLAEKIKMEEALDLAMKEREEQEKQLYKRYEAEAEFQANEIAELKDHVKRLRDALTGLRESAIVWPSDDDINVNIDDWNKYMNQGE